MSKFGSGGRWLWWLRRFVGGVGLLATFAAGAVGGWQVAWWQDTVPTATVLEPAGLVRAWRSSRVELLRGPVVAQAQRMPEAAPARESDPALAALEAAEELAELVEPIELAEELTPESGPEAEPLVTSAAVLDPRDRAIIPPSWIAPQPRAHRPAHPTDEIEPAPPAGQDVADRRPGALLAYVVQPGEGLGLIAARFGTTAEAIRVANGLDPDSVLQVGQSLRVPPVGEPIHVVLPGETLSEIAASYGVDLETVTTANELDAARLIRPDQRLLIPGGARPAAPTPTTTAAIARRFVAAAEPTVRPTTPPPPATPTPRRSTPTPVRPPPTATPQPPRPTATPTPTSAAAARSSTAPASARSLGWPLNGALTQRFRSDHAGLDIAAPVGAPIKAAAAGTVIVAAKVSTGYGWRIIIDHGGGYTTLYAHLSAFNVAKGQQVSKGQVIGAVGATGVATGPHLHFEVGVNGTPSDPLKYLP